MHATPVHIWEKTRTEISALNCWCVCSLRCVQWSKLVESASETTRREKSRWARLLSWLCRWRKPGFVFFFVVVFSHSRFRNLGTCFWFCNPWVPPLILWVSSSVFWVCEHWSPNSDKINTFRWYPTMNECACVRWANEQHSFMLSASIPLPGGSLQIQCDLLVESLHTLSLPDGRTDGSLRCSVTYT